MSGNPFGLKLQGQSEHPRVEIREFKVGGSTSQKVVGKESVSEEMMATMG